MAELTGIPGFAPPSLEKTPLTRYAVAAELMATLTLTVSLVVAATAVSLGKRPLTRDEFVERPSAHMPIAPK